MKKILVFAALIWGLLIYTLNRLSAEPPIIPQEIYPKTRTISVDSSYRRYVLWRVYTQKLDTSIKISVATVSTKTELHNTYIYPDSNIGGDMIVDSVLRENFYTNRKWNVDIYDTTKFILKPNTYYLVLAEASCWDSVKECTFHLREEEDCILPDNPENRERLSKQWDKTKIVYEPIDWIAVDARKAICVENFIEHFKKQERQVSYKDIFMKPGLIRTTNEIKEVLDAHSAELKHSYKKYFDSGHLFTGTLALSFNIEANGNVSEVSTIPSILPGSINDPNFKDIIKKLISTWKFEKIEQGDVKVNITFKFQ
jgi:hypothetical protein